MISGPMTPPVRTLADVAPLAPELLVVGGAFALLMLDLFLDDRRRFLTHVLGVLVLLGAAAMVACGIGGQGTVMTGMFVRDTASDVLKVALLLVSAASLAYLWPYMRERGLYKGELVVLALFAVAGMMLMVSAGSLTVMYVGLELLALCSYALVATDRDSPVASEAAMKYFVLGALASGMLLYGMSLVYGATGTVDLATINDVAYGVAGRDRTLLLTGMVFVVVGVAFKFGAAPFHMWLPDTYHGAPTPVTLFIGSAPKLAAFGMAWRLFDVALGPTHEQLRLVLAVLAALSLVVGNLFAIAQTNLKRMLAYSTIAQMGFMLLGLTSGVVNGNTLSAANSYSSALFYVVTYVVTTLGSFGLIMLLSRQGFEAEEISDLKGLNQRSPWYAAVMAIFMFSLAGIPPTVGFYAKLAVLQALVSTNVGLYIWLAVFAVLLSLVGAFYYLRVVKVMYFDEAEDRSPIVASTEARAVLSANGLAVLVLGILPGGLMALCAQAIVRAFSI